MRVNTLLLLIILSFSSVKAQPISDPGSDQYRLYSTFNPSMAIVIVVLVCVFFFIGLFSILIRSCSDSSLYYPSPSSSRYLWARENTPRRGLAKSLIDTFPVMVYSEVKKFKFGREPMECAVCLSEFQDGEFLRLLPKCSHVFHPRCIDTWLASHVTCPVCRSNVEEVSTPETTSSSSNEEVVVISVQELESAPVRATGGRFPRSHSTGHSLVKEGVDRYTLRLPDEFMKEVINRANLYRTASLPREWSSRKGYKGNSTEGSGRGGRSGRWSVGSVKIPLNCINVKVESVMVGEPSTVVDRPLI